MAALCCLRFFTDDRGRTIVERGLDHVRGGFVKQQFIRFLAIFAAVSACFFVFYNVPAQWFGMHADPWPEDHLKRSYFNGGICGDGTDRALSRSRSADADQAIWLHQHRRQTGAAGRRRAPAGLFPSNEGTELLANSAIRRRPTSLRRHRSTGRWAMRSRSFARPPAVAAGAAEGPHGMRKDALRRGHGPRARPRADHRRRPRGHDLGGSGGSLPAQGRRNSLGGRAVDPGGARRRHLLSRRDRGGAPGHHRGDPSARRSPPRASDRPARHHAACGARVPAGDLLQPRLPERPEEHQGVDPPALRRASSSTSRPPDIETEVVAHEAGIDLADRASSGHSSATRSATWTARRCARCPPPGC